MQCFTTKLHGLTKILKAEIVFFFYMYSVNAVRILDTKGQVLSNEEWNTLPLYSLFLFAGTCIIFLFSRTQIHQCF